MPFLFARDAITPEAFLELASLGSLFADVITDGASPDSDSDGLVDLLDADDDDDGARWIGHFLLIHWKHSTSMVTVLAIMPIPMTMTMASTTRSFPLTHLSRLIRMAMVWKYTDTDDDNDGVVDADDAFPLDNSESVDTDNDGIGNNTDADDDGDEVVDSEDAFPLNPSESLDTDGRYR